MMLRPGSPAWSRQQIPFKKDTKPAEQLLMALSPVELFSNAFQKFIV